MASYSYFKHSFVINIGFTCTGIAFYPYINNNNNDAY